jgi:pyridoxine/pyridoxamine 5'-phosphate oxidase
MDKAALYSFMTRARYGVVSSLAADGTPQSALVGVAITPDLEIVFDTLLKTRKYANLSARPACSIALWWGGEQTVQIDGIAFEPTGSARERYREAYFVAWPDGRDRLAWAGITHLVVQPRWIRASDYDQSPPMIEETRFSG